MKRVFFILFFLGVIVEVKAQTLDSLQIIEKSKNYFKIYVENYFFDPYSYELLKITADTVTLGERLEFEMNILKNNKEFMYKDSTYYNWSIISVKKKLKKYPKILRNSEKLKKKNLEKYEETIRDYNYDKKILQDFRNKAAKLESDFLETQNMMNDKSLDFTKLALWMIYVHCYSANEHGNKVLGRYKFRMTTNGKGYGSIYKTN